MTNLVQKFNIANGQVYIAADGSLSGHLVVDASTYQDVDDVVVRPFTNLGVINETRRIDAFKLAMVRYSLANSIPPWVPDGVFKV